MAGDFVSIDVTYKSTPTAPKAKYFDASNTTGNIRCIQHESDLISPSPYAEPANPLFFEDIDGESHISRFVRNNYYNLTMDENGLEIATKDLSPEQLFRIRRDLADFNFEKIGFKHLQNGGVIHLLAAISPEILPFLRCREKSECLVILKIQESLPLDDRDWDFLIQVLCVASEESARFLIPLLTATLLISEKDTAFFIQAVQWILFKKIGTIVKLTIDDFQKTENATFSKNYKSDSNRK